MLIGLYGNCGGVVPRNGLLPIIVGEPADRCPTHFAFDPEIAALMDMVPSPIGPGSLSAQPRQTLPQDLREYVEAAMEWLAAYRSEQEVTHGG